VRVLSMQAIGVFALALVAGAAQATTRSSFLDVDSIVQVTPITSNTGLTYTVSLGSNPTFSVGGHTYAITDLIGFYVLSDDTDFSVLSPLATVNSPGPFSDDSTNSGPGGVAGWKSNPNSGIAAGGVQTFTLPANFAVSEIDRLGFHVRINGTFPGTTGNTGNITGPIPAPGACAMFAVGGIVALRRRRP
jgi:hypothetical protein